MTISVEKCCILNIGNPSSLSLGFKWHIDAQCLPVVRSCRDLGVVIYCDLSPSEHISTIVSRAHYRANVILRCFVTRNRNLLLKAFNVYVRPILEYNSIVWAPTSLQDIRRIEKVQRRFSKRLPGLAKLSYRERLQCLNTISLEHRRLILDLVMCYKIVFGIVTLQCESLFKCNTSRTRGHPYRLYKTHCGNCSTASFFGNRVINVWNGLTPEVDFSSLNKFKTSLASVDFSKFLRCSDK